MHDLRTSTQCNLMAIKLDMKRAYNHMSWNFLWLSLETFGFHQTWIEWILGYIYMPSFSILVNGTPLPFFQSTMGLYQDCSLSLYLLITCMPIYYLMLFML